MLRISSGIIKRLAVSLVMLSISALLRVYASDHADSGVSSADSTYTQVTVTRNDSITDIEAWKNPEESGGGRLEWVNQLVASGFHINDPSIKYPKFARWLLNVYNWGDKTFNSYDSDYVVGVGKNWKAKSKNDTWMRTYVMHFDDNSLMHISSKVYEDMGFDVSFMAANLGYTFNVNSWMGDNTSRHRFDFSFTCSLFSASFSKQSVKGGAIIRKFGDYKEGSHLSYDFSDIDVDDTNLDIYYFFNHKKYSQAAAYCYSKYQLRSAGSWVIGFNYLRQRLYMDFNGLPADMLAALPAIQRQYDFNYKDYNVLCGYAHNWVLKPRVWLINLTVMPSVGYKHTSQSSRSIRDMLSTNIEALGAVVYNHKWLFASLTGRFNGYINFGKSYTFFNSTQIMTASVGVRF